MEAFAEVDGVVFKEYKDPQDTSDNNFKVVKYLEVPPCASFQIRVKFAQTVKPEWSHVMIALYVDGVHFTGRVLDKKKRGIYLKDREIIISGRSEVQPNGEVWVFPLQLQELECEWPQISRHTTSLWIHLASGPINTKLTTKDVERFGKLEVKIYNYTKTSRSLRKVSTAKKLSEEMVPKNLLVNTTLTHSAG